MTAYLVRLLALLTVFVILAGQPARVSADERPPLERRTGPLVMRYVGDDRDEFAWYADATEQAYRDVHDVFAAALRSTSTPERDEIVVTLYGDDAAYRRVNPVADREEGVLGHANPRDGQIGVAVARLREKSEGFRADAIRHEIAHVVLGDLSRQKLTIGFQEGIAQYLERDLEQRRRFAVTVRRGQETNQLLSFAELNRQRTFLGKAGLAYPQSYSMVVFLAERYGLGRVIEYVVATRDARTPDEASSRVFGHDLATLEQEWLGFLPGFLDGGWARNDLDLWHLAGPRQLLTEGRYAESRDAYDRAEALFTSVGRTDRVAEARAERQRAVAGIEATELSHTGSAALSAYAYPQAAELLERAEQSWQALGDARRASLASLGATQARDGQHAVAQLAEARRQLDGWRFQEADDLAYEAGAVLAELGDVTRTEEARAIMADAQQLRTRLGLGAAAGGVLSIGTFGAVWLVGRQRRRPAPTLAQPRVATMERDWSL